MALNKGFVICYIPVCLFSGIGVTFGFFEVGEEILAVFFPLAMLSQYIFGPALFLLSLFIVLIILLQRGRGGGLTGALGGAGGASAFGVKAGDIFTRITAISVLLWIVLCALTTFWYLPDTLDIASDPASVSIKKSSASGMGGIGFGDPIPSETVPSETVPSENKTENSTPATETSVPTTSPVAPIDLPPAATLPAATTESAVKPVPTELPPAAPVTETPVDLPKSPAADPAADAPKSTEPKL